MVHITPETVEAFKQIFKKEYCIDYSDKEAWEATHNLVGAFNLLLHMDQKQHPEKYLKKENSKK